MMIILILSCGLKLYQPVALQLILRYFLFLKPALLTVYKENLSLFRYKKSEIDTVLLHAIPLFHINTPCPLQRTFIQYLKRTLFQTSLPFS